MEEARGEIKEIREEQTLFVGMLQTGTTNTEFLFIQICSYFKQKDWDSYAFLKGHGLSIHTRPGIAQKMLSMKTSLVVLEICD
jgi:hypothetical protein